MGGLPPAAMGFAEVAVDSPAGPGRTFSYSIPDGLRVVPATLSASRSAGGPSADS